MPLTISVDNSNSLEVSRFESHLTNIDLIYDFNIYKFNNKNNIYKIIFNGSPDQFLKIMLDNDYEYQCRLP